MSIALDLDDDDLPDEIAATDATVHVERLDDDLWIIHIREGQQTLTAHCSGLDIEWIDSAGDQ